MTPLPQQADNTGQAAPQPAPRVICVTGTDTDAGKSVVTAGLLRAFQRLGRPVQAIKAVQTGCGEPQPERHAPDVALYRDAAPGVPCKALATFKEPCSPHLAASLEGASLAAQTLVEQIRSEAAIFTGTTLVEGAGGLFVPLNEKECFIDLFVKLGAPLVLVAPNRLGTINHSLLSLEAISKRGLALLAFVLSKTEASDGGNALERRMAEDNPEIIARLARIAPRLSLPFFAGLGSSDAAKRSAAWNALSDTLMPLAGECSFP